MERWEKVVNYVNEKNQEHLDRIERDYKKKLRSASDAVVMQKLRMAEEQNHYLYDVTYQEAQRRGLV